MNDATALIPTWWLVLSGIFFVLVALLFLILCILVVKLISIASRLEPQVSALVRKVDELVPTVKNLVQKVEDITLKVEGIATSARGTVDEVGGKAKGIANTIDTVTSFAAQKFQQYAPLIGSVMAGLRILSMLRDYRSGSRSGRKAGSVRVLPASDGEPEEKGIIERRRGVEQSGSSSGS